MNTVKVFELIADVKNPTPDRRSKDWNKAPTLTKGQRFTLHSGRDFNYFHSSNQTYRCEPLHSELGKLIVFNAVEVSPQTFTEVSRVYGDDLDAATIAETLFKLGRIGPADFQAVVAYFDASQETETK